VAASPPLLHFAPFTLDRARHALTRDGEEVALSPHLVDILTHLAEHAGHTVSKDALLDTFWADVHVTENTLTRAIADIRKALGDDSGAPRYIQTVARRGYRFIAPIGMDHAETDPFREWVRGRLTLEALDARGLPGAIAAFEHAVLATPDYAPAHAGLASACFLAFERRRAENIPDREPLARALAHARRACALDAELGDAWAALALVLAANGETDESRAAARRAAALEPSNWRHHFRLALVSWGEERLRAVDRTLTLLPDFAPARLLAAMVFVARQAFAPAAALAAAGAEAQARQVVNDTSRFPAIGLHWLHGLLRLRDGDIGQAIAAFVLEIDGAQSERVYAAEFRVNAQVAAGFAHLAVKDAAGAAEAFRAALETLPRNGRALVGLYRALSLTSFARDAYDLLAQADRAVDELRQGGRSGEAAIVAAAGRAARGDRDGGCALLRQLLDAAPDGLTGWLIPIDPALADLRDAPAFQDVLRQLAARAR
jgi:DNA-binding winged helix-turn-helix (wHTH) protein